MTSDDLVARVQMLDLDDFVAAHPDMYVLAPQHAFAPRDSLRITARPQISTADRTLECPVVGHSVAAFTIYVLPPLERCTIGREAGNDIVIDDVMISRRHAAIVRRGDAFGVLDLDSSNGTRVRRMRVRPGEEIVIKVGDPIELGSLKFVFADSATCWQLGHARD